jgi:hypothetical protein
MSEEKDAAELAQEAAMGLHHDLADDVRGLVDQIQPSPGLPVRQAAIRHRERLHRMWGQLPEHTRQAILEEERLESSGALPGHPPIPAVPPSGWQDGRMASGSEAAASTAVLPPVRGAPQ